MSAQDLHKIANELRGEVLKMVVVAGAGHVAGPMSSAEIMATLYFSGMVDLENDKIILSCGHYVPIQYAALSRVGKIAKAELKTFMQVGSRLPGHPERGITPGIEVSAGPLGQGISVATGMAIGSRAKIYCIVSDGELQEGQLWEAINLAVARRLNNLIIIVDVNGIQIEHYVNEVVENTNYAGRFEAFGAHVIEIDGNDVSQVVSALERAKRIVGQVVVIVAKTVAGKGVSFMENEPEWHDRVPTRVELKVALEELQC